MDRKDSCAQLGVARNGLFAVISMSKSDARDQTALKAIRKDIIKARAGLGCQLGFSDLRGDLEGCAKNEMHISGVGCVGVDRFPAVTEIPVRTEGMDLEGFKAAWAKEHAL